MQIRARYDGEDLAAAEGLLIALATLLDPLEEGDAIEVTSERAGMVDDLRAWCRRAGHRLVAAERANGCTHLIIARGGIRRTLADPPEWGVRVRMRDGRVDMRDWREGRHRDVRDEAPAGGALAPRGAVVETGAPLVEFSVRRRSDVWADSLAELYEQATAGQWSGARDIPWGELAVGAEEVERATCQLMTFLAENEYAALYVPARFLGQVHPHYTEAALFMATVLADEARHIEVFTKRALANGGGLGVAAASTQLSLASLFEPVDFSTASFLLSVLGEGTFLDLLMFLETHAPDGATREICRRARIDEARHVRFGIAHARLALESQAGAVRRFIAAVEARADFLKSVSGVGALVEESLIVYAGGALSPSALRDGVRRVAGLYETMHANRVRRLQAAGFGVDDADRISRLHTPNFM
jgi:TusA-related sulfurtransferase